MGLFGKNKIAIFLFVGVHIMVASLFFVEHVSAASVSWDGGGGNSDWCNINNWSNDALPTDADDLTINTAVTVVFTTCNPGDIDFNSLTIGGSAAATVDINQDFGTAGDITIANLGVLEQNTTSQISISGDLTVESGGTLKHADNSTTHLYSVNISAANIDIQSGGSVNVDGLGYDTGGENGAGSGPGGGGAGSNGGGGGGGASHAGNGGSGSVGAGGVAYCDISNPSTMGSGGSGGASGAGVSDGGGYISLVASNTLTVDGTITADGEVGNTYRGGGAGGGIKLVASTIAGTPTSITATGGTATTNAGGGGGGCVLVEYSATATFSSNSVSTLNGTGSTQSGGAGLYLLKKNDQNGILYVQGSSAVAATPQNSTSETYELISILGATSNYVVDTDETLTLTPLSGDDVFSNTGILDVDGVFNLSSSNINEVTIYLSGTYNNASTLTLASGSTLYLQSGVVLSTPITTITNAGNLFIHKDADIADVSLADVTLQSGGTLTQYNFTTATPLTLETVTIQSGGKINHADNTTAQTHIVNIVAGTFTIDSGGSIDVNGLGYAAGGVNGAGSGPGGGGAGSNGGGGGGGASHAGNGGSGSVGAGGVAYCDISNPSTMGSGGSGGASGAGNSDGGGFVMLDVVGTLTVNGTITANATVRSSGNRTYRGGGAGGGINIDAAVVAGTPVLLSATGETATTAAGGGGGGCITIDYGASNSIGSATVSGGSGGVGSGASGSFTITQSNTQPTVSFDTTPSQINSTTVSTTITISDADLNETSLTIEYSQDGNPYTAATIGAVSVSEGSVTTSSGSIAGIDTDVDGEVTIVFEWLVGIDEPNLEEGNVYLRITPNDGTEDGGTNTSTVFAVDTSAPSAPSALDIFLATSSSVVLSLPDTPSYDTNFTEYLVYYSTTTPVLESDTSVSSSTDANLGAMDFNSATELESLGGLIPNTTYYFNIFAYDIFGQSTEALSEATTTTLAEMPVGLTFGSITTSSVTFVWNYGNNPTGTVYEVYNITDSVSVGTTTDDNMVLSGLTPGTYYEMYVRAQNSAGVYTDYTDLAYAITSPVPIDAPVVDTSTPASLDVVFDDLENGLETTYALYISTDDLYIDADGQVTSTPVYRSLFDWSGGISVLDLNPNQAYAFVALLDAGGVVASSPTSTVVYTLANVPEQFAWAGGTTSTAMLEFQTDGNPTSTEYAIFNETDETYVLLDGSASITAVWATVEAWGAITVTGLSVDTEYNFLSITKNEDGVLTSVSPSKTVYTSANVPGTPTIENLTTSTVELTIDTNDNPAHTTFAIYNNIAGNYFAADGTPTSTAVYQTMSTWGTPVVLTGLTPNIEYEFAVFAKNQFGTATDMSDATAIVVTYADVPDELVVESVSTSTIVLSWEDSGATQYKLYNVTDADSLVASVSITTATAIDLECGTSYTFRLSAHNLVDESSLTDATVTTSTLACPVEEEEEVEEPSSGGGAGGILLQKPNFGSTVGTDVNALTRAITVHRNRPTTTVRRVRVHIPAYIDTSEVAISTTSSFDGVRYRSIPRSRTIIVTLPKGYGKKELNIKLRTATGGTAVIKKEIVYEKRKTVVSVATPSVVPTAPIVSVPITTTFVSFLSRGSQGAEVLALQQVLQRAGYFPSTITPNGVYGPSTEESVRAFQRASSLDPLGYVGPGTRAALNTL